VLTDKLTGDALQKVEHGSDGTAVTAVPDTGYHFVKWSDGLTAAEADGYWYKGKLECNGVI
jgi:hypothetical protein